MDSLRTVVQAGYFKLLWQDRCSKIACLRTATSLYSYSRIVPEIMLLFDQNVPVCCVTLTHSEWDGDPLSGKLRLELLLRSTTETSLLVMTSTF